MEVKIQRLWLNSGDKNTSCFHKQARARLHRNNVKEIVLEDGIVLRNFS
jgi:hypothetical protein